MAEPLLDITTLIEQPTITINKVNYEILHPDQLGVIDFQRLAAMSGRVSGLMKKGEFDTSDATDLTEVINDLSDRIMVDVPPEVRDGLTETQRLAVVEVFMTLPGQAKLTRKAKAKTPSRSTGAKPSRGSRDSTAATPPAG